MNILILEDKQNNRVALEKIVSSCAGVDSIFAFSGRGEAWKCAMDNHIDLFLLDIILEPDKGNDNSGILFAENIRKYNEYKLTPIIFITVLAGLERDLLKRIHCYDYIEKPIGDGKLVKEHIEEVLDAISAGRKPDAREYVPLHYDGIGYMVFLDEVMFFENKAGTLHIHLVDDEIQIPNYSAKKFYGMIRQARFLSPIYGTYVNMVYIANVDFRNREVYMKDNSVIPIGGRKFKKFKQEYLKTDNK
jgi:two-component system LytT family response regulator